MQLYISIGVCVGCSSGVHRGAHQVVTPSVKLGEWGFGRAPMLHNAYCIVYGGFYLACDQQQQLLSKKAMLQM